MNILIVEDTAMIRESLSQFLRDEGHTVVEAEDGYKGYCKIVCFRNFDLMITDLQMPVWNGYELAREVRKVCSIPILLHTATLNPHRTPEITDVIEKCDFKAIKQWIDDFDKAHQIVVPQQGIVNG